MNCCSAPVGIWECKVLFLSSSRGRSNFRGLCGGSRGNAGSVIWNARRGGYRWRWRCLPEGRTGLRPQSKLLAGSFRGHQICFYLDFSISQHSQSGFLCAGRRGCRQEPDTALSAEGARSCAHGQGKRSLYSVAEAQTVPGAQLSLKRPLASEREPRSRSRQDKVASRGHTGIFLGGLGECFTEEVILRAGLEEDEAFSHVEEKGGCDVLCTPAPSNGQHRKLFV